MRRLFYILLMIMSLVFSAGAYAQPGSPIGRATATTVVYSAANQAAMLALAAKVGDFCVRADNGTTYVLQALPATVLGNWVSIIALPGGTAYQIRRINPGGTAEEWADIRTAFNATDYSPYTQTAASITAAIAAISTGTIVLKKGSWTIDANVTVPTGVTIRFEQGAILNLDVGHTFTFQVGSSIQAGLYQIFSGTGTVILTGRYREVYPEWWGATGDGATDDTAAVNAAIVAMTNGGVLFFGPRTYMCNLVLYSNITLQGSGIYATVLKAPANSDTDVIKGKDFATLTGTAKAVPETRGVNFTTIRDLTVDGNKANNAAGYGIRVWGRGMNWENLWVINTSQGGIWTEFTTHDSPTGADGEDPRAYAPESTFRNIWSCGHNGNGWDYKGPHDGSLSFYVSFANTGWALYQYSTYSSLTGYHWNSWLNTTGSYYIGESLIGVNITASAGYVGTGIELAALTGSSRITNGIIGGHVNGLILRGDSHYFQGQVLNNRNAATAATSTAGNAVIFDGSINCEVHVWGSGNYNGLSFVSEAGASKIYARLSVPTGGTLYSGTPNFADNLEIYNVADIASSVVVNVGSQMFRTLAVNTAQPSLLLGSSFKTANTLFTTLTGFTDAMAGKRYSIYFGDNLTTVCGNCTYIKGNGGVDWTPSVGDWIDVIYDGSVHRWTPHDCTP